MPDLLLPFLGEVALRSSLVLGAVFALLFAMKRASASERHLVMLFGLLVVVFVPVGLLLSPKISWTISLPQQAETSGLTQEMTAHFLEDHKKFQPSAPPSAAETKPSILEFLTISNVLAALILGGMLAQVLMLGQAAWSWQEIRQRAVKMRLSEETVEHAWIFTGAREVPPIFASDQITVPLLAGWLHPAIILPAEAHAWPSQRLVMVLCHELAHFRRGDALFLPLICTLRVLYWWHPLVWLALARLLREREAACDDLVLNQDFRATDYADLIVDTSRQTETLRWQSEALAMATPSHLSERIRAILNPRLNRRPASRTAILTGSILALALGWFFVAAQVQAEDQPVVSGSTTTTNAPKPQIHLDFRLVEIDEKTYQQQTTAIDEAVKNGNIAFLINLHGASVVLSPSVTTQAGLKADVSIGKVLIQGHKSTPVTTLTATSVLGTDGKVIPTVVKSPSVAPTKTLLGLDCEITPSISKDGSILLPSRYKIGYIEDYKSESDFYIWTFVTDKKLSVIDGKAVGFFAGYESASNGNRYTYSLSYILNSPGEEIKTPLTLSPSPNRLALIVSARRVDSNTTASVSIVPPKASEPK